MQRKTYSTSYHEFFSDPELNGLLDESIKMVNRAQRIFFIGNGGSNSITSHMMEDYGKMLRKQTFSFTDPALITCYANDYGYEQAFAEWLKLYQPTEKDLLIAISSSGKSPNILNTVEVATACACPSITLSGFEPENPLRKLGQLNVYVPYKSYGIVETLHQVFLHIVLDEIYESNG